MTNRQDKIIYQTSLNLCSRSAVFLDDWIWWSNISHTCSIVHQSHTCSIVHQSCSIGKKSANFFGQGRVEDQRMGKVPVHASCTAKMGQCRLPTGFLLGIFHKKSFCNMFFDVYPFPPKTFFPESETYGLK
ncbi:hypothetical protein CEXT_77531 [Caerostris extrusa]|uniref:Uncharacterized protein n=1 Tax=Caerostris extrusa TaxID=172846 RepID=A0AAV4N8M8_CAEEX|nr:hypothetical protein CEXT_77531 [Caerostris extrusa]